MSEQTSRENPDRLVREYFDSLLLELRTIDAVWADTRTNLFGTELAAPVMITALSGLDRRVRPGGMTDTAKGAAAAGTILWAGIGGEDELEALINTGAKVIKIVKPYADTDLIYKKIEHAEKAGALAVGMDTDFVFGRQSQPGYAMEYPVSPKTLDEIKGFVRATKLPFILKGILSEQDARKALEAGAGGIVVSHHGGIVDGAAPPLMALPRIAEVIGKKIPVFMDCGVTRGLDVFKALAFGADAALVGRAVMAGLARDGADGVRKVLEDIIAELRWAMCLTGAGDVARIDSSVILKRPW
jgi:isopentenyl diphosphate isomerase/L-lactate dehydrogenase-like FMN-dependent dehydrogenase